MCIFSPAASATVVLRNAVLVLAPNVDGGENERHQHGEAAHQGKDHDTLLLRLQGKRQRATLISEVWFPLFNTPSVDAGGQKWTQPWI